MSIQPVSMCTGRGAAEMAAMRSDVKNPDAAVERDYEETGSRAGSLVSSSLGTGEGRDCNDHAYVFSAGSRDREMSHGGSPLEWLGYGLARLFGWVRVDANYQEVQRADAQGRPAAAQPGDLAALPQSRGTVE